MHRSIAPAILLTAVAGAQQSLTLMTSPTSVAPMVFDEARDRAVEFTLLGEIFEYHRGVRLHRINLGPTAPGPRLSPGFVYDPARRRVLLFGGYSGSAVLADTWSWDGAAWTPMSSGPPGREDPGITFDSVRNRVVMYGGQQRFVGQLTDTWEHDGSQWIQRFPATTPTPNSPRLAFDLLRNVTVMISPSGFFGAPASTWEWNGTNWTQRNAGSSGPIGTNGEAIAYDPIRQRTVVAGGGSQTANNITIRPGQQIWEWDGSVWTQTATLNTTLRRYCWAWFDPTLGKVVVAGGPEPTGDTLELAFASWDGNTLQSTTLDAFPVSRFSFGWCSAPGGAVMFGGASGTSVYGDTWQWDGSGWQRLAPPTSPPARAEPAMAFDLLHATSVMFGGGGAGSQLGECGTAWCGCSASLPTAHRLATHRRWPTTSLPPTPCCSAAASARPRPINSTTPGSGPESTGSCARR